MTPKLKKDLKQKLKEEAKTIQEELESFADTPKVDTNYETKFPKFGEHTSEQDENADEVEKYTQNLSIEFALEKKLKDIEAALERLKKGSYGNCETCKKKIPDKRLKASPAAKTCLTCRTIS